MSNYLKNLCLGLSVLLLGCSTLSAQQRLGPDDVRERNPVITSAGDLLYFNRPDYFLNQGTENRSDIWFRHRDGRGKWQRAINPGSPVNSFGDDRMLGVSVDGNRLTVLRRGAVREIDLLQRSGRSWRVVNSWPVPQDVTDERELTFNTNSLTLVYSTSNPQSGSRDLYSRYAGPAGTWSPARPMTELNGEGDESAPAFAGDGRTLLFRRNGQWYSQADRGQTALQLDIPTRYLQVAVAGPVVVGMTDEDGRDERIESIGLDAEDLLPPAELHFASLGDPPAPGEHTTEVPLNSGVRLRVYPDLLDRYAIMLREGEVDFPRSNVPPIEQSRSPGSLASLHPPAERNRREYLRYSLARRERELARLDALRQQLNYAQPHPETVEWTRPRSPSGPTLSDTLPPANGQSSDYESTRSRYASDLEELKRMKEKFRRQQEARIRRRDQATSVPFVISEQAEAEPEVDRSADTALLRAEVRTGLYAPMPSRLSERLGWENELHSDLHPSRPVTDEDAARLDREYTRQMEEISTLRTQLREEESRSAFLRSDSSLASNQLTPKSVASVGSAPGAAGNLLPSLTFIPNTAYLNSQGFEAIDRLVEDIREALTVLEIRVHTAPDLEPRAAQELSEERAATIREQLVVLGVNPDQFRVIGFGNQVKGVEEGVVMLR